MCAFDCCTAVVVVVGGGVVDMTPVAGSAYVANHSFLGQYWSIIWGY